MWPNITYVDDNDKVIGGGSLDEAVSKNIAHRIVRVFVLNTKGELLVQKRSSTVSVPNKWDQSAAGHVDEKESYIAAAQRELQEEMGISSVELKEVTRYYDEERIDSHIRRHFNTIYTVHYDGLATMNRAEVADSKWVPLQELEQWMAQRPSDFTQGFLNAYKHYTSSKA